MKLGFIGTGNMGNPMAANLIKAGHQLTVHDLRREAAINLLEMGAEWADSPKEAGPGNEVVLTSLPVPRDVEAVVQGENGILEDDVLVHDETNKVMAHLLANMKSPTFPTAIGVLYCDTTPT